MAHLTSSVEYGMHCLLWLVDAKDTALSSRDLAALQGISPSFTAKIFAKLDKAGIVRSTEGVRGGYRLARPAQEITALEVVDAVEGQKPLFECQEIRGRCAVFGGAPPDWAMHGTCAIHAVMLRAEKAMRDELASQTLADVSRTVIRKAPTHFAGDLEAWLAERLSKRTGKTRDVDADQGGER